MLNFLNVKNWNLFTKFKNLKILLLFIILFLAITSPSLIQHKIISFESGDVYQVLAKFLSAPKELSEYIKHPHLIQLHNIFGFFATKDNITSVYNFSILFSFIFSAFGMYLLLDYLIPSISSLSIPSHKKNNTQSEKSDRKFSNNQSLHQLSNNKEFWKQDRGWKIFEVSHWFTLLNVKNITRSVCETSKIFHPLQTHYITFSKFFFAFIFSISSFHIFHLLVGNFGAGHIEWIPFFILYSLKYFERFQIKYFFLLSVFFSLITITEHHLTVIILTYVLFLFIFQIITKRRKLLNRKFIFHSLFSIFLVFMLVSTVFSDYLETSSENPEYLRPGLNQVIRYSMDPVTIIIPHTQHPLFKDRFQSIYNKLYWSKQRSSYLGIGIVTLIFFGFINQFYSKEKLQKKQLTSHWILRIWDFIENCKLKIKNSTRQHSVQNIISQQNYLFSITMFVFFTVLSIGPHLHFLGLIELGANHIKIPLPYFLFYKYIPFFDFIRNTKRIFLIAVIFGIVLANRGLLKLLKRMRNGTTLNVKDYIFASLFFILILFENWTFPLPSFTLKIPRFYELLAQSPNTGRILEIPGNTDYETASKSLFYQTIHHKEVANDYEFARITPGKFDREKRTPILWELMYDLPKDGDFENNFFQYNPKELADSIVNSENISYIILDTIEMNAEGLKALRHFIEKNITLENITKEDDLIVYEVSKIEPNAVFLYRNEEENKANLWNLKKKKPYKDDSFKIPVKDKAEIIVENIGISTKNLSINFFASAKPSEHVKLLFNEREISDLDLSESSKEFSIDLKAIPSGISKLQFSCDHDFNIGRFQYENKK